MFRNNICVNMSCRECNHSMMYWYCVPSIFHHNIYEYICCMVCYHNKINLYYVHAANFFCYYNIPEYQCYIEFLHSNISCCFVHTAFLHSISDCLNCRGYNHNKMCYCLVKIICLCSIYGSMSCKLGYYSKMHR